MDGKIPARLDMWIDYDHDGQFGGPDDPLERVSPGPGFKVTGASGEKFTFDIPPNARPGPTFARLRISTAGGLPPIGLANDGQVVDARVTLKEPRGSISGFVFLDVNDDGKKDLSNKGIGGVPISIEAFDADGVRQLSTSRVTQADGYYIYRGLDPQLFYNVTQGQPSAYKDGRARPGTPPSGSAQQNPDRFEELTRTDDGLNFLEYNFTELGLTDTATDARDNASAAELPDREAKEVAKGGGSTFWGFVSTIRAGFSAIIRNLPGGGGEGEPGDVSLELYTADMAPVVLGDMDGITAELSANEIYILALSGATSPTEVEITVDPLPQDPSIPREQLDANRDQAVTSFDALKLINFLNDEGPTKIEEGSELIDLDVNRDGLIVSRDVLTIINFLNLEGFSQVLFDSGSSEGEGESPAMFVMPDPDQEFTSSGAEARIELQPAAPIPPFPPRSPWTMRQTTTPLEDTGPVRDAVFAELDLDEEDFLAPESWSDLLVAESPFAPRK